MSALAPVLLAEDRPNDALLFQLAYEEAAIPNPLILVRDGLEAATHLGPPQAGRLLPALLITDLRMPGMDGFNLLAWLQQQPHLKCFPVVVLSSSDEPEDRRLALALGAQEYAQKPLCHEDTIRLVQRWASTWLAYHPGSLTPNPCLQLSDPLKTPCDFRPMPPSPPGVKPPSPPLT